MRPLVIIIAILCSIVNASSQNAYNEISNDHHKAGGVYYAYPVTSIHHTQAPTGYIPFYISHMSRHGSRFLLKESDYTKPLETLKLAHDNRCLTTYGESIYRKLDSLYTYSKDRAGDLTEIGVLQHKQIAKRMFSSYPEVFADSSTIVAHSTMVMRCAMSMAAFTESLKEENTRLKVIMEPSERHVKYLNNPTQEMKRYNAADGVWQTEYREYRKHHTPHQTFIPRIFSDSTFVINNINRENFTCQMYNIAISVQNLPVKFDFDNIFDIDELYDLWKIYNFRMYAHYSNYEISNGINLKGSIPLMLDMVTRADEAIKTGRSGADLRFGHDINIIPLTALFEFKGCNAIVDRPENVADVFQDYNISPMASNIQLIFYKNSSNDIIVKFLLNEKETEIPLNTTTFPFYKWNDVRQWLLNKTLLK